MRKHWDKWYSHEECSAFRAVRRAKLARVLRFYADKARRHYLPAARHTELVAEIDRMIEKGGDYRLDTDGSGDRGWIFCPEYAGASPLEISPDDRGTKVFLCGPSLLPDLDFRGETTTSSPESEARPPSEQDVAEGRSTVSVDHLEAVEGETEDAIDAIPSICFGTDPFTNTEVRWPLTVQGNPHLLIAGLPGMGKTTCLLNLCNQMMAAGIRPIVFSYHQDIDERLGQSADSVRFIDFDGLGFNPLEVVDRGLGWRISMWRVRCGIFSRPFIRNSVTFKPSASAGPSRKVSLNRDGETPMRLTADLQEPTFGRFAEILRGDPKPDRGLRTLLARLEELEDYGFFNLRESHSSLWESEQPTVIRIHTTQNDNLQRAFASLVFYGLYKDMFRRGIEDRITHALIFDEAHRAAGLKLIPTMAKECRKYGISLVLASQEAKDFDVSVFSAIANYLVLRLTEADAKSLVRNVSSSQQERVLIDKIKQMDRFKALYFCEGKSRPSSVDLSSY